MPQQIVSLKGLLRSQDVTTLKDFREDDNRWRIVESFTRVTCKTHQGDNSGQVWLMEHITTLDQPSEDLRLLDNNGWQWRTGQMQYEGWCHQNYQWKQILGKHMTDYSQFKRSWRLICQWVSGLGSGRNFGEALPFTMIGFFCGGW